MRALVEPEAPKAKVEVRAGELRVRVKEPAIGGAANRAAVLAVARFLGVEPAEVRIVSGQTSRRKTLSVPMEPARERGLRIAGPG